MRSSQSLLLAAVIAPLLLGCSDSTAPTQFTAANAKAFDVDPHPSAPGYFLSSITPQNCFKNLNAGIADADQDWLDDTCEFQLAYAFRPRLNFCAYEQCATREPYWAANYFPYQAVIRVAYMFGYYMDCGTGGHAGDSELIIVTAAFDPVDQHWKLQDLWTSAHQGVCCGYDKSHLAPASDVTFWDRPLGSPDVVVLTSSPRRSQFVGCESNRRPWRRTHEEKPVH